MKKISNIIFDLGGVLINIDPQATVYQFEKLGLKNVDFFKKNYEKNGIFYDFEEGKLSSDKLYELIKSEINLNITNQEIDFAWNAMLLDFPKQKIDLLKRLKKDYNLILLSNTNEIHVKYFEKQLLNEYNLKFEDLFHSHYYSNEIGIRKPNIEAFDLILKKEGIDATETIFIDDMKENCIAAEKLGINTIFLDLENNSNLIELLKDF
ncbi:MAG: HAD family phosphatase [Marinifilaceae bacterium]|jgi:putative hydrolase of the HAD superfamily|nr:HAD family phosphatase [Marinifilaceae bacterium]